MKWVREESLSQIKQLEVLDQEVARIEGDLEYVKNINKPVQIQDVPMRIITRYHDNLQFLLKNINLLIESIRNKVSMSGISDELGVHFGFKKMFIALTECGKLVSLSSIDGHVIWSEYFPQHPQKVFIRSTGERGDISASAELNANLAS